MAGIGASSLRAHGPREVAACSVEGHMGAIASGSYPTGGAERPIMGRATQSVTGQNAPAGTSTHATILGAFFCPALPSTNPSKKQMHEKKNWRQTDMAVRHTHAFRIMAMKVKLEWGAPASQGCLAPPSRFFYTYMRLGVK